MVDATTRLLRRLIHDPAHIAAIQTLDDHRFSALVQAVGLEDAGELLAIATSRQILTTLDETIWRSPGSGIDERLDPERFAVWLEVLLEGGEALAAQRLSVLPEPLLVAGLCSQLFVFPADTLGHRMSEASWEEAELAERVLDEALYLDFDRYTLVARHGLGWDATIAILLALDALDHDRVVRVLEACHGATKETLDEADGWHTVLSAQETIEVDAAADREDRRSRQGYVSPAAASSFLALANQTSLDDAPPSEDPITRAYFRQLEMQTLSGGGPSGSRRPSLDDEPRIHALLAELATSHEGRASSSFAAPELSDVVDALRRGLVDLETRNPGRYDQQMARLTYLANVLMAAGRPDGSPYIPVDAGHDAMQFCALGLRDVDSRAIRHQDAWEILMTWNADALFRRGWRLSAT